MTHLKKSLAMFLALVMMFSTLSVAASAWTVNDDPDDISFTVKFFRESPAGSGDWIKTEKAAPGEKVKARIYIETGYYTYGGETAFIFDRDFFSVTGLNDGVRTALNVNQNYAGPSDDAYGAGGYNLAADATWRATTDYDSWFNKWNIHYYMDYIVEEIEKDADFFKSHDFISSNVEFGSTINNSKLADDDWMYEFELVVADNTVTNTVNETGEAEVPPYYYSKDRFIADENGDYFDDVELPINVSKGESGKYRNKNIGMWDWLPEFTTNPGVISTTSEIIFDMGLVDGNGAWYEDTYTTIDGIIGKEADLSAITNPTHPDGLVFSHWSTQKPGEGVAQDKVSTISCDYDALTLYAVWTDVPDVSYTLKEFYMNADGSYPADVEGVQKAAAPNSTVSAPESTDPLYTLNTELSSKDVVINADSSSVVNAYYERNKYKLVYHYEDNTGFVTDDYSVRFGAELPAFQSNPSGQPDRVGYTFLGWATEEGGEPVTLPSVMPTEDLHLYAVYEPIIIEFIFNALEGSFANGESVKRYSYKYGEATETPEEPTAPGKDFVDWDDDVPATAYENKEFEAIYEDAIYHVTFKADTDNDGEYETIVAEKESVYGEKLYPEFAPENYPIDAWKLEDGTAVVFSDDEKTAYTVTGDVDFYTIGSDEYPARFYWSEEDMESGAEPYTTIYVKYGEEIPAPQDPVNPGYTFMQWELDLDGQTMDSTDGKDFYAIFETNEITVTYDPNGGECGVETNEADYGESVVLPEATRDGYEFLGWVNPDGETVGTAGDEYAVPTEDVTLKADWKAEKHTITFVNTGDTVIPAIEADTDAEIEAPDAPTKKGHEFTGWVNEAGEAAEVPAKMPAEDMVLTATWNKLSYEFNADANGGKFSDGSDAIDTEIPYGDALNVEEPKMDGHKFLGWANADDESNTIINLPATMPDEAINIKAVWDTNKHSVYYDAAGGLFDDGTGFKKFDNVEYGAEIPAPATNPERDGYTFVRWNPEAPEAMPDAELNFTAVWEKIPEPEAVEYNVYISYPNPANPAEILETSVITDSALPGTTVEVIKAGEGKTADKAHTYEEILANVTVNGIEPDYDNRPDAITVDENGGKLVVSFKLTEYEIEFNPNGGNFSGSEDSVIVTGTLGQAVEAPADPTRTGYTFTGWDNDVPETFTEDIVINATWEIQSHNAIFVVVDENGNEVARIPVEYNYGETIVAPSYSAPEGYEFNGWDVPAGTTMGEEDKEFTSTLEPIYYSLSYNVTGLPEGVTAPATQNGIRGDEEVSVAAATVVEGYTFDGWYNGEEKIAADGSGKIEFAYNNITLTGKYTVKEYSITFDPNGAAEDVEDAKYNYGELVETLPTVTKEGYTFLGWYEGETKVEAGFNMPARDMNLEAKWQEIVVGTSIITLDANGGKFSNGDPVYSVESQIGDPFAVPANPTREGYDFIGWTDVDGNPTTIPTVFPAEDVILKAKWEPKEYTITFDSNGGSEVASQTYKFGDEVIAPADPTREGFTFIKWNPELPATMPANDITVVAEWEALVVTKTLTIDANGGTFEDGTSVKEETLAVGEEIKDLPVPTREGYTFEGWTGIPEDGKMPEEDITIKAEWAPVGIPEHNVEYYYAVGGELYDTLTFKEGETIVHPEGPVVEGFTFKGWADENGNELPEVMGTEDIEAYAKLEINKYKVTYIVDGSVYMEYEVAYQAEVPVPADPQDTAELLFAGWEPNVEDVMPAHDLTYTAKWVSATEPDEYTATFLRHNGETHAKYVLEEGDIIPVPAAPERFGYVFVGWEPEVPDTMPAQDMVFEPKYEIDKTFVTIAIGGGVVIAGGAIAGSIIGANIAAITGASIVGGILVIIGVSELVKHTHTVTYLVDGEVYKTFKVIEGTKIPVPADPAKDGFTFEGWNPEVPERMGNEDLVFEATWAENDVQGSTDAEVDVEIPATGSVTGGLTAFAVISGAAAAAYVITRRKKED